jgi:hypothetical protein
MALPIGEPVLTGLSYLGPALVLHRI